MHMTSQAPEFAEALKSCDLHPCVTDLIYYDGPNQRGDEVVDHTLACRPIEL
ncbi:hypothetical protein GCM10010276_73020 [Streptomyces longisporus]|uniref:Uncharacterized protein n=1 Tax=Streptomyces longisporus TaxID=1948 RepID=A0ABP6AFD1_STRLO